MTSNIGDILRTRVQDEPPEVGIIKTFIDDRFQVTPTVQINAHAITIIVPSGSLAGALRVHMHELQELCQTDKKLIIRIG